MYKFYKLDKTTKNIIKWLYSIDLKFYIFEIIYKRGMKIGTTIS